MYCTADHLLLWQQSDEIKGPGTTQFQSRAAFDYTKANLLTNLLEGSRLWSIEVSQAVTINPIDQVRSDGQWTDPAKFVCGYFVIRGDLDSVMRKSEEIDRSYARDYLDRLSPEARDDITAHATTTYTAVSEIDATAMMFWANHYEGPPRMPVELAMGAINAYNAWGRQLREEDLLLDAGRMNVRHGASHIVQDEVFDGPYSGTRLIALGSYARNGASPVEAVRRSRIASEDPSLVVGIQACNGWCRAMSDEPAHDDPKFAIFV